MDMLRKRLEQQKYDNMVRNIRPAPNTMSLFSPDEEGYSAADAKMTKNQVSAIINILLSMISVFVAIFIWMKNSPDYLVPLSSRSGPLQWLMTAGTVEFLFRVGGWGK